MHWSMLKIKQASIFWLLQHQFQNFFFTRRLLASGLSRISPIVWLHYPKKKRELIHPLSREVMNMVHRKERKNYQVIFVIRENKGEMKISLPARKQFKSRSSLNLMLWSKYVFWFITNNQGIQRLSLVKWGREGERGKEKGTDKGILGKGDAYRRLWEKVKMIMLSMKWNGSTFHQGRLVLIDIEWDRQSFVVIPSVQHDLQNGAHSKNWRTCFMSVFLAC